MTGQRETMSTRTGPTPVKVAIALTLAGLVALIWFAPDGSSGGGGARSDTTLVASPVREGEPVPGLGDGYPLLQEPRAIDGGTRDDFPPDERVPGETPGPPGL